GDAAQVVVAVGLAPRTADLRLNLPRIDTDELSFIRVDPRMRTSNERVYAVGDVNGLATLATAAIKQAKIAAEDLAGLPVAYAPQAIPRVAWTDPPVASVGLTSAEAEAAGYTVAAGRFTLAASGRALTLNAPDGVALVVAEKDSGVLLGATLVGAQAGDLIGEMTLALEMGATLTDIAETLHAHPGLGEALQEASEAALGAAVHLLRPV
ncbi:MAG: FAD-dependent oxidoreductase, partial [Anaerolineae bacterium]|nr:FAD-dependent oxidoreductase [Anaerolineae bacterium]